MSAPVEVICPTEAELAEQPRRNVPCTVDGCDKQLATTAALHMHVIKRHGIYKNKLERGLFSNHPQIKELTVQKQYFCPIQKCSRNKNSGYPFQNMWPLKQHYQRMHGKRNFLCRKCEFPFAFEVQCQKHEEQCGRLFTCSCGVPFTTRQAMCTHARRRTHEVPPSDHPAKTKATRRNNVQPRSKRPKNIKPSSLLTVQSVNRILTVPVQTSQGSNNLPCLMTTAQPLQILNAVPTANQRTPPSKILQRLLLPKPVAVNMSGTQSVNPEVATGIQTADAPIRHRSANEKQSRGTQTSKSKNSVLKMLPTPAIKPANSQERLFRNLGINTQLNVSNNCQTQTAVEQNTAHTQTPGDVILQEALKSAAINVQLPLREPQHVNELQQQEVAQLQQGMQPFTMKPPAMEPTQRSPIFPQSSDIIITSAQPVQPNSIKTPTPFSPNPSCSTQNDNWLSSLVPVDSEAMLTYPAGVPTQTDLSFLDFLNGSSEAQILFNQSTLPRETAPMESASTQTAPSSTALTETGIQTITAQCPTQDKNDMAALQSTMETQTNIYATYLDSLLLNKSQCQTSLGEAGLDKDMSSLCCQQTQTLNATSPQTDHQETQTALFNLSSNDFLLLDMYTQTAQRSLQNTSLQTQTDPFLDYSLSSMHTQTMADFDLSAFDYHSISVQTDSCIPNAPEGQLANRTQAHTQTTTSIGSSSNSNSNRMDAANEDI